MKSLIGAILILGSLNAAANGFSRVEARGTGCPVGSTDVVVSPDGESVSVLFNEMIVELPNFDGDNDNDADIPGHDRTSRFNRNVVQKICNVLIEADIPQGHKVDSVDVQIDFRGSTFMDQGTGAFFHSQLVGLAGPGRRNEVRRDFVARKIWRQGPTEDDWIISSKRNIKVAGNCSTRGDTANRFNLRNIVRANLTPQGQRNDSYVFIGLDSADIVGKMKLKVNPSACRQAPTRPTRPTWPPRPTRPTRPTRPALGDSDCPRGLIFHAPTRSCKSKRQIAIWDLRN